MLKPLFLFLSLVPFSFLSQEPAPAPSAIPPDAAKLVNPYKSTPESLAKAKKIYGYDCALCHGANGNGKGDVVGDLKLTLKDYTDPAALKDFSDGELYYIITKGKGQMPPEEGRCKPEDLWNMVVLVRSFSKKPS